MVSERDRAKMHRIGTDLAAGEIDDRGTVDQRADILGIVNGKRRRAGRDLLDDRAPEEGFYDRAKSLGMARIDR